MSNNPYLDTWYTHCPKCKASLEISGNLASCKACSFVYYHNPAPAVTVLIEKDNQLLLAKRAIEPQKGKWDCVGGFASIGESVEDCLLREVKEETNLAVKIIKYLGSVADVYGPDKKPTLNFLFLTKIVSGEAKAQDDVAKLKWFNINEIPEPLAFKNCYAAIDKYKNL